MQKNHEPSELANSSASKNSLAVYISSIPLLLSLWAYPGQDVRVYWHAASSIVKGQIPYLDFPLEYPPYAILCWIIPVLANNLNLFALIFAVQILALDAVFKFSLIGKKLSSGNTSDKYVTLICFSISVIALRSLYLQRMDLIPALLSVITIITFSKGRYITAGISLSIGVGMKLYPALFFVPLLTLASKEKCIRKFVLGTTIGALPIFITTPFVPWWKFLDMHLARGLQVESTYASFMWLIGKLHPLDLKWIQTPYCHELSGGVAQTCLPFCQLVFVATTLFTVFHVSYITLKQSYQEYSLQEIARIMLLVLFPFVLFNKVFSPQYLIWLNTLAVIAFANPSYRWFLCLITLATVATPYFYPSREYHSGLSFIQTLVLVSRNVSLIVVWAVMYYRYINESKSVRPLQC